MKLVLFDMDHTLVPADTGSKLMDYLYKNNLVSQEEFDRRKLFQQEYHDGTLDVVEACKFDVGLVAHVESLIDKTIFEQFFIQEVKPIIMQKAIAKVKEHQDSGDYVVIITATVEEIARPIAEFFAVDFLIGGKGARDNNGKLIGELINGPCMREGKLIHLQEWLSKSGRLFNKTIFYSDSHNDIPLLDYVDEAVIVDADNKLIEYAKHKGWQHISLLD